MKHYPYHAKSYAKINLTLHITGKRADGYHLLESLMVPVSLSDTLKFAPSHEFSYCGPGSLTNKENLIYRAWRELRQRYPVGGVDVVHQKHIPMGGGLGGGSSNAAVTLTALSQLYRLDIGYAELSAIALTLGADVPFFLRCTPALARGIGEVLDDVIVAPLHILLISPDRGLSTPQVYRNLDYRGDPPASGGSSIAPGQVWKYDDIIRVCHNDLEKGARPLFPEMDTIKSDLISCGAGAACLSGSGSTVFGIFPDQDCLQSACTFLQQKYPKYRIFPVKTLPNLSESTGYV